MSQRSRVFFWTILVLTLIGVLSLIGSDYWAIAGGPSIIACIVLFVDAWKRRSVGAASVVAGLMSAAIVASGSLGLVAFGLNNAYSHTVVDRASTLEFDGIGFQEGSQICGDGADYSGCLNMHIAMFNSVCTSTPFWSRDLTISARQSCDSLDSFIEDVRARNASCGYGCTTTANAEGIWGWPYLQPVPDMIQSPAITHEEHCWFELGPLTLGSCPGRP